MTTLWIADRKRAELAAAGLATFDEVMSTTAGRCLRVLPDRENWYVPAVAEAPKQSPLSLRERVRVRAIEAGDAPSSLPSPHPLPLSQRERGDGRSVPSTRLANASGFYLKKHCRRTWLTRLAAVLGFAPPASAGRVEAENAIALHAHGIDVMPLTAYGEKLHVDGRMESFLLSEELDGYCELQDFIARRFAKVSGTFRASETLHKLIVQVAQIARRFHAAGFNHRDFYCCHFLIKETSPEVFDIRLIDLQRVQRRRWFRRRWIVKDLAQLASMSPDDQIGCREKVLFLRAYLGVKKLRRQDKRLIRSVLAKLAFIRRHTRIITARVSEAPILTRSVSEEDAARFSSSLTLRASNEGNTP